MDTLSPRRIAQETNDLAPSAAATLGRRIVRQGRSRRYGVVLQRRCERNGGTITGSRRERNVPRPAPALSFPSVPSSDHWLPLIALFTA
jgi:hypothetical protein